MSQNTTEAIRPAFESMLGGNAPGIEWKVQADPSKADIDDGAFLLLAHVRQNFLGQTDQSKEIDVELAAAIRNGSLLGRPRNGKARVIDEDVNAIVLFLEDALDSLNDLLLIGNVHLDGVCAGLDKVLHAIDATRGSAHNMTAPDQSQGGVFANPGTGTCDEDHLFLAGSGGWCEKREDCTHGE